jgi:PepSY-associated TM region
MPVKKMSWEKPFRFVHRSAMVFGALFLIYVGITGVILQGIDLKTVAAYLPATDATMQSIRDGISGPPNFYVITNADYAAPSFPKSFDSQAAIRVVSEAARQTFGKENVDFVELRMRGSHPVGVVQAAGRLDTFDAQNGKLVATSAAKPIEIPNRPGSARDVVKSWHRMVAFGSFVAWVELATTLMLVIMTISGLGLYARMLILELKNGRRSLFWFRGDGWRALHRSVALVAAAFLLGARLETSRPQRCEPIDDVSRITAQRCGSSRNVGENPDVSRA